MKLNNNNNNNNNNNKNGNINNNALRSSHFPNILPGFLLIICRSAVKYRVKYEEFT